MNVYSKIFFIVCFLSNCLFQKVASEIIFNYNQLILSSPNGINKMIVGISKSGRPYYQIYERGTLLLDTSSLSLNIEHRELSSFKNIELIASRRKTKNYSIFNTKRALNNFSYFSYIISLNNSSDSLQLEVAMSNDGFAFRYFINKKDSGNIEVNKECTSFHFVLGTKAFLQPIAIAKSGWEATNPSYEENYIQDVPVGTPESTNTGWVYPALFHKGDIWLAITEAGLDGSYCATRLSAQSPEGEYKVTFPDAREGISTTHGLLPYSDTSFYSPWRVVAIGSLKKIIESTWGTDIAPAAKYPVDLSKPGQASWSWINSKDDFIVYDEQKKYIDFAAEMHWKYCLIDAGWDTKIGYAKIAELAAYAKSKNIGLLLWYNSAGDWNTVKYTPRNKLLTHASRMEEFAKLQKMGVKGVKIDFFGGDGRSVIQYYVDILNDAAAYGLLVNFHGATLPRGWEKTYPNLMTTEAVKGFEMITFDQKAADQEANHVAMLPFTRNLFDPMDFTPMNLYKIPTDIKRRTTSGFELATSVLLISGIQHFAESPEGMAHMPLYVKKFLQNLPSYWDDVKFIEGYPGKYVVIARRSGKKWFIAGINAEKKERKIKLDEVFLKKAAFVQLYSDADIPVLIKKSKIVNGTTISIKPNGGFVIVAE